MMPASKKTARICLALLMPFVALGLTELLWSVIRPHVWFLFYPAVLIACRLGGRDLGLIATAASTVLVAWRFLAPGGSFAVEPRYFVSMGVFFATGVAYAYFDDRASKAMKAESAKAQLENDLREMTKLHDRLESVAKERRIFEALVENSSDFIGIADASGRPIYLNPAGRQMVGLLPDARIEDTSIADFYPPDQRALASEVIVKSMIEQGQWQGETYFRNWQTEEAIPVSDKHFLIRDPQRGRTLGMATITRDISDRRALEHEGRRAHEELADARDLLENVLESSTLYSIIAMDLERRILLWNRGAERNYGYEAREVVGRSSDLIHVPQEVHTGAVAELHRRALEEGHADGLLRRRRKDGTEFLARVVVTRRNDANGNAVGYVVVSHDVTAEQRLFREQEFLAQVGDVLQASLDPIATLEQIARLAVSYIGDTCSIDLVEEDGGIRRTKFVITDPAKAALAAALEGFPPVRVVPHPIWKVLETKRAELISEVTTGLLRSVAQSEEHLRLMESLALRSVILVPLVAHDRTLAVLSIGCASPGRRYDEQDLKLCQELARRSSAALDNARLYDVAQKAISTRDHVLSVVAHDLRNPLGAILAAVSALRRPGGEPERRAMAPVNSVERAITRMNRLIQDLLDVSRVETGRLTVQPGRLSTWQAVREYAEAQEALVAGASLELRVELEPDTPDLWADHDRLSQVFANLIGNAVKFTQPGGLIVVRAVPRGRDVLFSVGDTGCGIAASDIAHLFDLFWQADKSGRRGTGLGLAIVKGIVEAHGGRIWAESELGRGTKFFFTIPTAVVGQDRATTPERFGPPCAARHEVANRRP
jgi:PAS domain S-box-containing protein